MTTTVVVIIVIVLVVAAVAAYLITRKNSRDKDADIARAEELRTHAATQAQSTIAPAQQNAAEAEAKAEAARVQAEHAQTEAHEAEVAAHQAEAEHEAQVRAADRLDPRVDHTADDYSPQVPGSVDQQPTSPSEVNTQAQAGPTTASTDGMSSDGMGTDGTATSQDAGAPELPRRTRGAQEMPGKPIEKSDDGGGWFTRKESDGDRA